MILEEKLRIKIKSQNKYKFLTLSKGVIYLIDKNNNKVNLSVFGFKAFKMLDSLKNCYNCIDCLNCVNCDYCFNCVNCVNCSFNDKKTNIKNFFFSLKI
jgi:hypothetical protein